MATTYKKNLKTIVVTTIGGASVTATDTVEKPVASNALAEFEAFKTMHIEGESLTLIPFHAVDHIVVTSAKSGSIDRPDPYCPDPYGE